MFRRITFGDRLLIVKELYLSFHSRAVKLLDFPNVQIQNLPHSMSIFKDGEGFKEKEQENMLMS